MSFRKCLAGACMVAGMSIALLGGAMAETIKIGVIAPLTGGAAPWGMITAEGAKIRAAEINAKGGLEIGGKKYDIQIIAYDDQYKASDAVAAYNRLLTYDNAKYVVLFSSAATLALKQQVEDDKVVALTVAASEKAIDATTRAIFRVYTPPSDFVPPLVAWVKANLPERRVVLLSPNDETGWVALQAAASAFKQEGFDVAGSDVYERSQNDFQPLLTKLLGLKPEMIDLGAAAPATAVLLVRQARELGFRGRFIKTAGGSVNEIIAGAGKEAAEGLVSVQYVDQSNPGFRRVAEAYQASVGQPPNEMIATLYDAAAVLMRAIELSGDPNDTAKVRAAFAKALPMQSVQGETLTLGGKARYGADQQIMTVSYVSLVKDGVPRLVGKAQ